MGVEAFNDGFYHTRASHCVVRVGKDSGTGMVESVKTRALYMSGFHLISWPGM